MNSLSRMVYIGAGLVAAFCGCSKEQKLNSMNSGPPKAVRTASAELRPMARIIYVTGTLAARDKSILSAKVAGRLQILPVDIGAMVYRGAVLAQIEPRDFELNLQQAKATLAQARTALGLPAAGEDDGIDLEGISSVRQANAVLDEATANRERIKTLSLAGIATKSELDTVEAAYKVAASRRDTAVEDAHARAATVAQRRAEFELAQKQLTDASVRAPFDGAVQLCLAHVGEYLSPGTPILELVKIDPLRLRLRVPERECTLVRTGQVVQLHVEGETNAYPGKIARLSPALDEQSRMLLVEADVPARGSLRPGLFARASIMVDDKQEALSIQSEALITFAGIEKVMVIENGRAKERAVVTGRRGPGWVEIVAGLRHAEQVVLSPAGMRTGDLVRIDLGKASSSTATSPCTSEQLDAEAR